MKSAGANLVTLFATVNVYAMADLYTFTLADASNTVLRYTSASSDIGPFSALGPRISRGKIRSVVGVEVDTLPVTLGVNETILVGNLPMAQFARNGGFDGARLTLSRSFAASWNVAPAGNLSMFSGRVADVELTGTKIELTINSDLELLNVMMPRNQYQAACIHTLYGPGCGLVADDFTVTGNTTANSTRTAINCNLAEDAGYFDMGTLEFTSGALAGLRRTVKLHTTGVLVPIPPLPYVPAEGDLFTAKPGCDKLVATCNSPKFENLANFRGFPFIPVPEAGY